MALRLKYTNKFSIFNPPAGEASFQFSIQPKLKKAVKQLLTIRQLADEQLYILPTYTAMLEIRKILNQMGLVHSSWED